MAEGNGRNDGLDDLEREAERDRAALAGTVEALRGRLGSSGDGLSGAVSARARGYVEDRRAAAIEGVWRRVEENPLQTVALATALAYPFVRIATKIPAPILLLGAGVALAGRGGSGQVRPRQPAPNPSETQVTVTTAPTTMVGTGQATEQDDGAGRMPMSNEPGVRDETVEPDEHLSGADALSSIGRRAVEAGRTGGETVVETIRRNPAIAGGVSLAIGAVLAALLPRTRVESQAFGEAAEDARERVRSLADEGIDAGRRAIGAAAEEAEAQDLTGSGARDAIQTGTDRVSDTIRDMADDAEDAVDGSLRDDPDGGSGTASG